jgi:neutral trehalase
MQYTAQIASELGQMERASVWQTRSRSIAARVHSYLWDDQDGFYYDRDVSGAFERVQAVSGFFPLLLDDIPAEHIGALVTALHDPRRFDAPWPVPSLALSHPAFSTDMWRGPTWINTNYVIIQGLLKHGLADEARWLAQATIALVEKYYERYGVLFEFFDAQDRVPPPLCDRKGPHQEPYNIRRKMDSIRDYHWTAALTARLLLDETDRKKGKAPQ